MSELPTKERFLADVASHAMTVLLDAGQHRHLSFNDGSSINSFNIVTWPGRLCIDGDMGAFVFERVPDMFNFFRNNEQLGINPSYWAEKCTASDVSTGGVRKFDFDAAVASALEAVSDMNGEVSDITSEVEDDSEDTDESERSVARALKAHLALVERDEIGFWAAIREFEHSDFSSDVYEYIDDQRYTYHFIWCLRAIVWAISQYDAAKASPAESTEGDEPGGA